MAPLSARSSSPLKRTLPQTGEPAAQASPSKRLRKPYAHHHSFQAYQEEILDQSTFFDRETIDQLLCRSIGLALRHDGFEIADPVALESFRAEVEEFMLHFCANIRQSMMACRRTESIPHDFEYALHSNDITLSSLQPHLKPPIPASISQPALPTPPPESPSMSTFDFLGTELTGANNRPAYIPAHLPALPSRHTYKATPVYTQREQDPRKIRERATEEGRLGEEALRRIVAKSKREGDAKNRRRSGKEETMDSMWEKTVQAVIQGGSKKRPKGPLPDEVEVLLDQFTGRPRERSSTVGLEIDLSMGESSRKAAQGSTTALSKVESGPVVNSERRYWRKSKQEGAQKPTKEQVVVEAQDVMMDDS